MDESLSAASDPHRSDLRPPGGARVVAAHRSHPTCRCDPSGVSWRL